MAAAVLQRNPSISFDTLPGGRKTRKHSFDYKQSEADPYSRRQSIKYHFPIPLLDETEVNETVVSEDEIRKSVYGLPLSQMSFVAVESAVWRPTVASCRRSVLWSRERKLYEAQSRQRMEEFKEKPYMQHQYPELKRHYPGTWRLATKQEINGIVVRLTKNPAPTSASVMGRRRIQSAPPNLPILHTRSGMTKRPTTSNTI